MKKLLFCCACLLGFVPVRVQAQSGPLSVTEREMPTPQADAELRALARQQAAHLADRLLLNQLQTRHLQQALYEQFWQSRVREEAQPTGQPVPAETNTALQRAYYRQLLRVLSCNQYAALLRLDGSPVAPFAPLAVASRYVPAGRLLARRPAHRL